MICGGASRESAPDDQSKAAMSGVKDVVFSALKSKYSVDADDCEVKSYTSQVVAGMIYEVTFTVSVKGVAQPKQWRAKIFESLPCNDEPPHELMELGPK